MDEEALSNLSDEQIEKAIEELKVIASDTSLPLEKRQKAKDNAMVLFDIIDGKQQVAVEEVKKSATEQAIENIPSLSQRLGIGALTALGMPTDLVVSAYNRLQNYGAEYASALGKMKGEEIDPEELMGPGLDELTGNILPTGDNLKRSVQAYGNLIGVDILGDYQRPAEGFFEKTFETIGEIAVPFLGITKAAQVANTALRGAAPQTITQRLAKDIADEAATSPNRMIAADLGAAPAMVAVEEMGGGPELQAIAGLTSPLAVYGITKTPTAQAIKYTNKQIQQAKAPPSVAKKEGNVAAKVLQELADNPEAVIKRLDASVDDATLSVAQRTEDRLLMSLEAQLLRAIGDEKAALRNRDLEKTVQDLTNNILQRGTNIRDVKKIAELRKESFQDTMTLKLQKASTDINETLTRLQFNNPTKSPTELQDIANLAVRETLEKALDDVIKQERKLWYKIPMSAKGSQQNLVKTLQQILKTESRATAEDIPEVVKFINTKMFKRDGKLNTVKESVKELKGLYTKLGEVQRNSIGAGLFNKARIAGDLQDAILKDMDSWTGRNATINNRIKEAREFSRQKAKYFKDGTVGDYLGYTRKGELRVPEALTAERVFRGSSANRLLKALDITEAEQFAKTATGVVDEKLGTLSGLDDYLKATFLREVVDNGVVDQKKAKAFLKINDRVLNLVPSTRIQLMRARTQSDVAKRLEKNIDAYSNALSKQADSVFAKLLNADPDNVIRKILSADRADKVEQMKILVNIAKKEKLGIEGLKNALAKYMVDEAMSQSALSTVAGRPIINANKLLNRLMDDKTLDESLRLVFSPKEMSDIRYAVKQMKLIQDDMASLGVDLPEAVQGTIAEKLFTLIGVKAGARLGTGQVGSPLVLAGEGRKIATKLFKQLNPDKARQLLIDAFQDEKLMKILLKKSVQPKQRRGIVDTAKQALLKLSNAEIKVLRSYMVAPLIEDPAQEEFMEERRLKNIETLNELLGM